VPSTKSTLSYSLTANIDRTQVTFDIFFLGGLVTNNDYAHQPHCFDTCHLAGSSLQRHSVSIASTSFHSISSMATFAEDLVTTPKCFEIKPPFPYLSNRTISSLISINDTFNHSISNLSLSSSAVAILSSSSWPSIMLTWIVFLR
jgi:hypothetical protein